MSGVSSAELLTSENVTSCLDSIYCKKKEKKSVSTGHLFLLILDACSEVAVILSVKVNIVGTRKTAFVG